MIQDGFLICHCGLVRFWHKQYLVKFREQLWSCLKESNFTFGIGNRMCTLVLKVKVSYFLAHPSTITSCLRGFAEL